MTNKEQESLKNKIKQLKAALAADKKRWGGEYQDGMGLRYAPPKYYIKLNDFTGGLRYFNWFQKNFPDDACFPDFLFEWTMVLFKTKRYEEAEQMAFKTFCRNVYLFEAFLGRPVVPIEKWEGSNLETAGFAEDYFSYRSQQEDWNDFTDWLVNITTSDKFIALSHQFIDIRKQLRTEKDLEKRRLLLQLEYDLEKEM